MFQSEDKVSVLFTYYNGEGDANDLILQQARLKNMSVYLGLPQVKNFSKILQSMQVTNHKYYSLEKEVATLIFTKPEL